MEKQRNNRTRRFIKRLLISFLSFTLFLSFIFPETVLIENEPYAIKNDLSVTGHYLENNNGEIAGKGEDKKELLLFKVIENQNFFTGEDIQFEIYIPDVLSHELELSEKSLINSNVDNNKDGPDFIFKSMDKFQLPNGRGTKIYVWYTFNKKGTYTVTPLMFLIKGEEIFINFEQVTIKDNPEKIQPRIAIDFSNGVMIYSDSELEDQPVFKYPSGKKLNFTVYLQYAAHINHFSFDIPKDSIYKQVKTYETKESSYEENNITDILIPVADFQWTNLTPGFAPIPKFKIEVTNYNGMKTELIMPEFKIYFTGQENNREPQDYSNMFSESFSESFTENDSSGKVKITLEDCEKLAQLHSKEKDSVFFQNKYKKERTALEESLGLPSEKSYFNKGILYFFIILSFVFVFLLFMAVKRKSAPGIFIFSIFLFLSLVSVLFSANKINKLSGITKGGRVYSIPEKTAQAFSEIAAGNLVLITEKTDNWYYVQLGETSGWCLKNNIIVIK